jgi:hypothetical protein
LPEATKTEAVGAQRTAAAAEPAEIWSCERSDRMTTEGGMQLLHFVFGGELKDLDGTEFRDLSQLDIVGIFPDYASAEQAWRSKAQATVDNAHMRYFVAHLHRLLDPSKSAE